MGLLSAALIVKNEAELLPDCLRSLHRFADEIVVYDTGSSDGSIDIARQAGARVVEGHWDDDFARARNEAAAACTGSWVLRIDADERVSGYPRAMRASLAEACSPIVFVPLNMGSLTLAGHIYNPRAARWSGPIHEILCGAEPPNVPVTEMTVKGIMIRRVRPSNSPESIERNLQAALKAIGNGCTDPFPGYVELMAAFCLASLGRVDDARDMTERAEDLVPAGLCPHLAGIASTARRLIRSELRARQTR